MRNAAEIWVKWGDVKAPELPTGGGFTVLSLIAPN
jgi:hypothetical protein